ncbi:hypothetical protein ACWCQP_45815 [Streptomyces chartreusis]
MGVAKLIARLSRPFPEARSAGWKRCAVVLRATAEQEAAREAFAAGRDLALVAGAGTGKTSTLVMMGSASRGQGLYVAFNKPIAAEARKRFGPNVRCRTSHSLAHQAVGRRFQGRLDASRHMPLSPTARLLGLDRDLAVDKKRLRATTLARLVMEMVRRFCYSTDEQVAARHLGAVNGLDDRGVQYLLSDQMALAEQPFAAFRHLPDHRRVCGPVFAGSADLGGADADFIVDGLLIDCKATIRPHSLNRAAVQQLAGYLLLDYDDTYSIDRVGLYLSRHGSLITWTVPQFLNGLGARAPLPQLRRQLRDHLRQSKQAKRPAHG